MVYTYSLKKEICERICFNRESTIKTAKEYGIPLKSIEKWITAYNKNNNCFDSHDSNLCHYIISQKESDDLYDDMSDDELRKQLLKKDIEIARLKKGYTVKGGGMEKKVFISFSKKNTK